MIARKTLACTVLALSSVAVLPAVGQVRSSTGYNPNSSNNQNSATAQAGKQVNEARQNVAKIEQQMGRSRTRIRAQLLAKPEFASVNAEYTKARGAEDAARKQAINALHNKPEYQRLQKERADAQAKVDAANSGQQVTDAELQQATGTVFKDGEAMKKMESQALADDAKYQDAKSKADAAKTKVDAVDSQVTEALKNDADYQQLTQQLDQAKQQLEQAKQQLAQAAQTERQQREQENKSRSSSSGSGSSAGRGR